MRIPKILLFLISLLWLLSACQENSVSTPNATTETTTPSVKDIQPAAEVLSWPRRKEELIRQMGRECKTIDDSIIFIRRYAYRETRMGDPGINASNKYTGINDFGIERFHNIFENDSFTVYHSEAASFLVKLYQDFGYLAFYYATGTDSFGHGQVIVRFPRDGIIVYAIMDPTFNLHYSAGDGKILDFRTMVQMLQDDARKNDVTVVQLREPASYLQADSVAYPGFCCYDASQLEAIRRSHNPKVPYLIRAPRTLSQYLAHGGKEEFTRIAYARGWNIDFDEIADFRYIPMCKRRIYGERGYLLDAQIHELMYGAAGME